MCSGVLEVEVEVEYETEGGRGWFCGGRAGRDAVSVSELQAQAVDAAR
jgi:hypothetical protein